MKNNLGKMMGLDLYFSFLSLKEYNQLVPEVEINHMATPLLSWDIYSEHSSKQIADIRKQREIKSFFEFAKKFQFQNNFDQIFSTHDFEALVVTNTAKKIVWASNGFKKMTGYSKNFAINKSTDFLQGEQTSAETKAKIGKYILANQPFSETLINYKKDNTPYRCQLDVFPLYTEKTTHYLALEKQIK